VPFEIVEPVHPTETLLAPAVAVTFPGALRVPTLAFALPDPCVVQYAHALPATQRTATAARASLSIRRLFTCLRSRCSRA
jgi:hypothetical protein